jgi:TPP-dependent 2-oxoacid decarboxylase
MKMPTRQQWKEFWTLFAVQLVSYCLFCLSMIVVTRGNYVLTILTDTAYGANSWFIIRRVAKADASSAFGMVGYTVGGTIGSLLAIWITKRVHG